MKKVLVANRGEIAARIIRSCQELGLETLAVYAPVDRDLPFVAAADQAIGLQSNDSRHSYLNGPLLLETARKYGADAVHPGYGFLSENADFARACQEQGLVFIGPEPETIARMGSKIAARRSMSAAGIPVVPGFEGPIAEFAAAAEALGYPVLIKASAGGGGRGMRLVQTPAELAAAIDSAGNEALKAFGDGSLLLEKYLSPVRHIEVQIVGDGRGRVWHLLERECSLQRRYQKVIEEAPAPNLRPETRQQLYQAALRVGELLRYKSLGTVEFAVDAQERIYFLECNTRIQVEHPVTEAITGLDLVALQLQIAANEPLELVQAEIVPRGHAFECRLYAEDPARDFAPSVGTIARFRVPEQNGFRCDAGVVSSSQVSVYFDALLAKLIAHGPNRSVALARMRRLANSTEMLGLKTNLPFLQAVLQTAGLEAGDVSTELLATLAWQPAGVAPAVCLATLLAHHQRLRSQGPLPALRPGFRNLPYRWALADYQINETLLTLEYDYDRRGQLACRLDGVAYLAAAIVCARDQIRFELEQRDFRFTIAWQGEQLWLHHPQLGTFQAISIPRLKAPRTRRLQNAYVCQMPGKVLKILVEPQQPVQRQQPLFVIESMKMETQILAEADGVVKAIHIAENQLIEAGALCLEMHSDSSGAD